MACSSSEDQPLARRNDQNLSRPSFPSNILSSPNLNIPANFHSMSRIYHPDGSIEERIMTNQQMERCSRCNRDFQNREVLNRHVQDTSRRCAMCGKTWNCCATGLRAWEKLGVCLYSCQKHKVCFETPYDAQNHAEEEVHNRCYYVACQTIKTGKWKNSEIIAHVEKYHSNGNLWGTGNVGQF